MLPRNFEQDLLHTLTYWGSEMGRALVRGCGCYVFGFSILNTKGLRVVVERVLLLF